MAEHTHPLEGTWKANISKSKRHPLNLFQSATLQFHVSGDVVTIVNFEVDESGQERHHKQSIVVDGKEHVVDNGYALRARWLGSHVLETVAVKIRDSLASGEGTYEVSKDGKILTISARNAREAAHGWQTDFEQVIVCDRQ